MRTMALIGAGGKMGCRITNNVKNSDWRVHYVESATCRPAAAHRLRREMLFTPEASRPQMS